MSNTLLDKSGGATRLLLGNEAIVRGALEAGIQVVTCYPGTPSSEVPDTFFRLSPEGDYYFEYSTNEKVALEVGGGAALAGAKTLTTMKHVGVNVAADPLMTLAYVGTPGGFILLSADDPACHSSQNEQDNRYYARLGHMPCFEPATAQEAKDMVKKAFELSRKHRSPVLLRTTTRVNHLRAPVKFEALPEKEEVAGFTKNPKECVPIPAFARMMRQALVKKMAALAEESDNSEFNTITGSGKLGIIASGISRAYVQDVIDENGLSEKVKLFNLGMSYPLPEKSILNFLKDVDQVLILEELEPLVETEVRALAQANGISVPVMGKGFGGLTKIGEFSTSIVAKAVAEFTGGDFTEDEHITIDQPLPLRPPNLCAGCPHRATYFAVRQVYGDSAVYSSDIGCYTLGILPPLGMADFLVCMGSSVSAGCGMSRASGQDVVAFIGDSTFFHSGMTGLINAVYNKHDVLLVVLDNFTTAMTGHQPHPGVHDTVFGENNSRVDIETVVKGFGVTQVRKVKALNLKQTVDAITELKAMKGVRVLISEEPCPLFARRALRVKKPMTAYVAEQGESVEKCLETLACPAFYKNDSQIGIDENLCSGCMFCLQLSKGIKARKRG